MSGCRYTFMRLPDASKKTLLVLSAENLLTGTVLHTHDASRKGLPRWAMERHHAQSRVQERVLEFLGQGYEIADPSTSLLANAGTHYPGGLCPDKMLGEADIHRLTEHWPACYGLGYLFGGVTKVMVQRAYVDLREVTEAVPELGVSVTLSTESRGPVLHASESGAGEGPIFGFMPDAVPLGSETNAFLNGSGSAVGLWETCGFAWDLVCRCLAASLQRDGAQVELSCPRGKSGPAGLSMTTEAYSDFRWAPYRDKLRPALADLGLLATPDRFRGKAVSLSGGTFRF